MNHPSRKLLSRLFLTASILLFVASLTQIGFHVGRSHNPRDPALGVMILLVGWLGLMASMDNPFSAALAWLANPALAVTWILMFVGSSRRIALGCGLVSLLLSLSFLLHSEIMGDEAGNYYKITGYGVGYWLWLGSIVIAVIGCIVAMTLRREDQRSEGHGPPA